MKWTRRIVRWSRRRPGCLPVLDRSTNPPTPLNPCSYKVDGEFREPTFSASVDWSVTDDALIYLAHRHGYRSGGFGHRAQFTSDLEVPFEPETVDDVEIGLKADWFPGDTSLRTNLAFYYSDYQDIQRLISRTVTLVSGTSQSVTTIENAADATIYGAEFEFTFLPTDSLEISGFYNYLNALTTSSSARRSVTSRIVRSRTRPRTHTALRFVTRCHCRRAWVSFRSKATTGGPMSTPGVMHTMQPASPTLTDCSMRASTGATSSVRRWMLPRTAGISQTKNITCLA